MTFNFNPMTEEELNASNLVEEGIYEFEVLRSTREQSRAGNAMAKLNIRYVDKEGRGHTLFDYLVFSDVPLNIRKVKHFCESIGLVEEYKKGLLPEELGGYRGQFKISIQKGQEIPVDKLNGKPLGSCYPDKNVVEDYVGRVESAKSVPSDINFDSQIPF